MAEDRKINRAIRLGSRIYAEGDEADLYRRLPAEAAGAHVKAGRLAGNWDGSGADADKAEEEERAVRDPTLAAAAGRARRGGSGFPDKFPGASDLAEQGLANPAAVRAYLDNGGSLRDLDGVGKVTERKILQALDRKAPEGEAEGEAEGEGETPEGEAESEAEAEAES